MTGSEAGGSEPTAMQPPGPLLACTPRSGTQVGVRRVAYGCGEQHAPAYPMCIAGVAILATSPPEDLTRLFVIEQAGAIRIIDDDTLHASPFLDISADAGGPVVAGGEMGLLGLAFHPDYANNRKFYVDLTGNNPDTNDTTHPFVDVVMEFTASATDPNVADPTSGKVVLSIPDPFGNHNGGMIEFGNDGLLYISTGDGGSGGDPENRAQNMNTLLGKMIRLDVSRAQPQTEIVALGLRNPWRYSFDRLTGTLWIGDVGQNALEEIDRLARPGTGLVNFGWDVYEGRSTFEGKDLGPGRLVQPVAQYGRDAGCSVTGGYVYRGPTIPRISGRYVFGDYCSGNVWSMPAAGGAIRLESVKLPGLSSFGEGLKGELYAVSHEGAVYRFVR